MKYFFLTFFLLAFFKVYSQSGNYFLSHYSPREDRFDNVCFDILQNEKGLIYFATRKGVLEFDGKNWSLIEGKGAVYSLHLSQQGDIYWAGTSGYGKISFDNNGLSQLETLSTEKNIFQALVANKKLCFLNEKTLFIVVSDPSKPLTFSSTPVTGAFTGMFELFGMVYVTTERGGIFKVTNDKLVRTDLGFSDDDQVIFSCGIQNQYLIVLSNNKVYLCGENMKPQALHLQDQAYVDASVIVNGSWVNRDLFVLGTLRGGMVFVNAVTGKTQEITNYATGLPDNEIFALMSDRNQGIWAAHEYGFTRIAPYLPFRSFSHYPGLQGNLLCALTFQEDVYVGTSLGLFKLEKEDVYEELYYVNEDIPLKHKEISVQTPAVPETQKSPPAAAPETESRKGGFLKFLKKNRTKGTTAPNPVPSESEQTSELLPAAASDKPITRRHKKADKVLRTSQYVFKKVKGVNAKVTQLLEVNDNLIAAGLGGTYEVNGLGAKPILDEPARFVFASSRNMLLISTYADEVKTMRRDAQGWKMLNLLDHLDDQINFIFAGIRDDLWLCALDKVYQLEAGTTAVGDMRTIEINNPNYNEYVGIAWQEAIMIANAQGFFQYDKNKNTFTTVDSLSHIPLRNYFAANQSIWYRDEHSWSLFGKAKGQSNLKLLNLFENLRFISPDHNPENLWIITGNNELYQFYGERFTPYEVGYSIILKSVRSADLTLGNAKKLAFEEDKNPLTFEVVQPHYLASQAIEYRYQLKGLEEDWTAWSSNNSTVNFPYLPADDYVLKVQARDIFGRIKDMPAVSFKVLPPYWQRPWFYALEFFMFAFLVVVSFRLSTRYRIISRILSLLTIIMLIQFIQTVVGATFETKASPVTDFFVQVLVAFLILPVEGYLRNLMLRSLDSHSELYKFLIPRANSAREGQQEQ